MIWDWIYWQLSDCDEEKFIRGLEFKLVMIMKKIKKKFSLLTFIAFQFESFVIKSRMYTKLRVVFGLAFFLRQ